MFVLCLFVFNATATPKIFTYAHTRSLHDAFPSLSAECCTDEGAGDRRTKKPPVDVSGTGKGIAGRGRAETALHLVGGKRREGRQSSPEQRGNDEQAAAAGDRIDETRERRYEAQKYDDFGGQFQGGPFK